MATAHITAGAPVSDTMVRLKIDFENPATEWWENGGRELWEAVGEGFEWS